MSDKIYHIITSQELTSAKDNNVYIPGGYKVEGFIHCCFAHQVAGILRRFYADATDLVILEIEPQKLNCSVVAENLEGGEELFPHIYDILPKEAVVKVHSLYKTDSGQWLLPKVFELK